MMSFRRCCAIVVLIAASSGLAQADDTSSTPKAVPLTRPAMKSALDDLKDREPRLPLPDVEEIDPEDGRPRANNGRMRELYLPEELTSARSARREDPNLKFDYRFSVMLFWITSRANNCHYCLGHQENKLRAVEVTDDELAALDSEWSRFTPAEQAAFAFAKKLTYRPHAITDADFEALRKHYDDMRILEIVLLVSRYNATNRWTDALGIPTEDYRVFETPTSPQYRDSRSIVAPCRIPPGNAVAGAPRPPERPPLESRAEVDQKLAEAATRTGRLPLASIEDAKKLTTSGGPSANANWVRLLANFPVTGGRWINVIDAAEKHGRLSPILKAKIAWTAARHDRAWYALALAEQRLRALGVSDEELATLHEIDSVGDAGLREVLAFAAQLTIAPQFTTDADIARLREHFSDHEVAEIVYHITQAAFFNRLTEMARLPIETTGQAEIQQVSP